MSKNLSKILNYTVIGIFMAIEIFYIFICTVCLILAPSIVDFKEMLFLFVHSITLLAVSVNSIIKIKKGKRFVIILSIIQKLLLWWFLICSIAVYDHGITSATVLIIIFNLVMIFILGFIFNKLRNKNKINPNTNAKKSLLPDFQLINVKNLWDSAAQEYCRIYGKDINALTDEENYKIYEYAATPIAYFLAWLIKNDLVSESFLKEHNFEDIDDIKNEKASPVDFIESKLDYKLFRGDINKEISYFVDYYFAFRNFYYYSESDRYFIFDYYTAVKNNNHAYYCVDFSWDKYHEVEKLINESYDYHNRSCEHFIEEEVDLFRRSKTRWNNFKEEFELLESDGVSEEYAKKCVEHLNSRGDKFFDDLCNKFLEMDIEFDEENKREILNQIQPFSMMINSPHGNEPAYIVCGECDFEDHGFSFTVRGDYILDLCHYMDYESPWCYQNEIKYKIAESESLIDLKAINTKEKLNHTVEMGLLESTYIKPLFLSGNKNESNIIYLPPYVAEFKNICDVHIESLFSLGIADECDVEARYKGDSLIPNKLILTGKKQSKCVYYQTIEIFK